MADTETTISTENSSSIPTEMTIPTRISTDIPHKKFHHIVNSSVKSKLKKVDTSVNVLATVEEKIDGSNLYFASDGSTAVIGRKNGILHDSAKFCNFQKLFYLKSKIIELHQKLNIPNSTIYLYGELIPTQKRIKYVEDPETTAFISFALKIVINIEFAKGEEEVNYWLDRSEWQAPAEQCGFIVNPILFQGTFAECLDYEVENVMSTVPQLLGFHLQSQIEGIIIKYNGSVWKKKSRLFVEMEKGGHTVHISGISVIEQQVADLISSMLTTNRVDNVLSGIDNDIEPNPLRLANTVVLDAIEETRDDDDCFIHKISRTKVCKIQRALALEFSATVKEYMNW